MDKPLAQGNRTGVSFRSACAAPGSRTTWQSGFRGIEAWHERHDRSTLDDHARPRRRRLHRPGGARGASPRVGGARPPPLGGDRLRPHLPGADGRARAGHPGHAGADAGGAGRGHPGPAPTARERPGRGEGDRGPAPGQPDPRLAPGARRPPPVRDRDAGHGASAGRRAVAGHGASAGRRAVAGHGASAGGRAGRPHAARDANTGTRADAGPRPRLPRPGPCRPVGPRAGASARRPRCSTSAAPTGRRRQRAASCHRWSSATPSCGW